VAKCSHNEFQVAGVALTCMKDKPAYVSIRAELMSDPALTLDKVRSKVRLMDNIAKMDAPEQTGQAMHTYGIMGQAGGASAAATIFLNSRQIPSGGRHRGRGSTTGEITEAEGPTGAEVQVAEVMVQVMAGGEADLAEAGAQVLEAEVTQAGVMANRADNSSI
jgi:hypothetical protein